MNLLSPRTATDQDVEDQYSWELAAQRPSGHSRHNPDRRSQGRGPSSGWGYWGGRVSDQLPGAGPSARGGAPVSQILYRLGRRAVLRSGSDSRRDGDRRSDLRHMRMTRSVDSVQFLPFLTTEVNNLGWLSYGTLKGDGTLIVVNAVGAVLQMLYISAYLHYCSRKRAVLLQTATLLGVLLLGYGYFGLLVPDPEARLQQLGLFCSVFTISMYLSPLADLVPNIPGILTSFIRLCLFWKYPQEQDRNYRLLQT
ncbi:sugar transporter SWEET1 isoform X2 [Nycticebus coucang]|uniref:sugar transporter SWEET1 isoform X2 n=1 Tax=Nycticebus coucang TaxID=9470 RepID=UPI00234D7F3E|nr:sugar transporter SWEET1 isoform X2 [Nycticebus coucang]